MVATTRITTLLEKEIPGFTSAKVGLTFAQLGVDSFGMLELRVAIGHALGSPIVDTAWIGLETPEQPVAFDAEPPALVGHADGGRLASGTPDFSGAFARGPCRLGAPPRPAGAEPGRTYLYR